MRAGIAPLSRVDTGEEERTIRDQSGVVESAAVKTGFGRRAMRSAGFGVSSRTATQPAKAPTSRARAPGSSPRREELGHSVK
jgi:hypothetical protein